MNNIKYYIKNEEEQGRGRGDVYEGQVSFFQSKTTNIDICEPGTCEDLKEFKIKEIKFSSNYINNTHIFCCTYIPITWFELDEMSDTRKLKIPEKTFKKMKSEYGQYVSVIEASSFVRLVEKVSKEKDLDVIHSRICYEDFTGNQISRAELFNNQDNRFFFQKDINFKDEYEYRFVFLKLLSSKAETIDLGNKIKIMNDIKIIDDLPLLEIYNL